MFNIDFIEILSRLKLASFIACVVFGVLLVYFFIQFQKLVGLKLEAAKALLKIPDSAPGGAGQSRWGEIIRHIESNREAEWKFAVIEADKLVDDILKKSGYLGDTMGERLMNIDKTQLLSLDGLWEAHKVRNKLVHDANYFLRYAEARQAVKLYENALIELNALK